MMLLITNKADKKTNNLLGVTGAECLFVMVEICVANESCDLFAAFDSRQNNRTIT